MDPADLMQPGTKETGGYLFAPLASEKDLHDSTPAQARHRHKQRVIACLVPTRIAYMLSEQEQWQAKQINGGWVSRGPSVCAAHHANCNAPLLWSGLFLLCVEGWTWYALE